MAIFHDKPAYQRIEGTMIIKTLIEFSQKLPINTAIIAIDYGGKKTGVAISNQERTMAMPITTIYQIKEEEKIKAILELVRKYSACGIVIGLPIGMDGQANDQTTIILKFSEKLGESTELPIFLQDERLTSKAADSLLKSIGMKRRQRNMRDDAIAASMILETSLESMRKF